ncbi:MAG: DUF2236 domain-containing protein [Solirubrobacteraceae bacterium]|nr:DUF2236 domain-containing protein [Solirubrobacteraceae bacterium]
MPSDKATATRSPATGTPTPTLIDEPLPREVADTLNGFALLAGGANVIMQLSQLPIGHGVALSKVESGRVDLHPFKRLRTTASFLAISMTGSVEDRIGLRREIGRAHVQVRSEPGDAVQYSAFDSELQLWVASCLYYGIEDVFRRMYGRWPTREERVRMLHYGRRLGTTLQVTDEMWHTTPEAFDRYWHAGLANARMDDLTRGHLQDIATQRFLFTRLLRFGWPVELMAKLLAIPASFMTIGFLPAPLQEELGLPWSTKAQRRHDRIFNTLAWGAARVPLRLRMLPVTFNAWETRRRLRKGRPVV